MAAEKIHITQFLERARLYPVIDVRSPAEYRHAHFPGAHSLPLFSDEERKVVGTTYKQQSRELAIKAGLDFFGQKMRGMLETAETILANHTIPGSGYTGSRQVLLYCWRGGMRSAAIAWLLDLYGFKVYTLTGGYKSFRNRVLDIFRFPFRFKILGGYTGSGKTELLSALKRRGERVIDLEAIASHKGSAFGNIGLPVQPGQEMFENLLAMELLKNSNHQIPNSRANTEDEVNEDSPLTIDPSPIWLEDESQRIGLVNLPNDLWKTMRSSPVCFLDIPFEERLRHIVEEYGQLDKGKMAEAIGRIREKLGGLNARTAIQLLEEENTIESFRILLKYYDRFYLKALHNREGVNALLQRIECNAVTPENARLLIHPHPQEV